MVSTPRPLATKVLHSSFSKGSMSLACLTTEPKSVETLLENICSSNVCSFYIQGVMFSPETKWHASCRSFCCTRPSVLIFSNAGAQSLGGTVIKFQAVAALPYERCSHISVFLQWSIIQCCILVVFFSSFEFTVKTLVTLSQFWHSMLSFSSV